MIYKVGEILMEMNEESVCEFARKILRYRLIYSLQIQQMNRNWGFWMLPDTRIGENYDVSWGETMPLTI